MGNPHQPAPIMKDPAVVLMVQSCAGLQIPTSQHETGPVGVQVFPSVSFLHLFSGIIINRKLLIYILFMKFWLLLKYIFLNEENKGQPISNVTQPRPFRSRFGIPYPKPSMRQIDYGAGHIWVGTGMDLPQAVLNPTHCHPGPTCDARPCLDQMTEL